MKNLKRQRKVNFQISPFPTVLTKAKTRLSRSGTEQLWDHRTQTSTTVFTWWALLAGQIIQSSQWRWSSAQRLICHALTATETWPTNLSCSRIGIHQPQWRRCWSASSKRWLPTRVPSSQQTAPFTEKRVICANEQSLPVRLKPAQETPAFHETQAVRRAWS